MKLALLFALTAAASAIDECGDADDCTSCLNPSHGSGNCGWCSPTPIVYADGSKGKRCADLRDTSHGGGWQCYGKLETDQCLQGWVCGGDATKYQCVPAAKPGEGTPSYADCQAGCTPRPSFKCSDPKSGQCVACTDPADPSCTHNYTACQDGCVDASLYSCNSLSGKCEKCAKGDPGCVSAAECSATCSVKYGCDFPTNTSAKPTCKPCKDPKSQDCKYASEGDCTQGCDWNYKCDLTDKSGPKCTKTKYGIPKKEWCMEQCEVTYDCDEGAKTCNITQGGGGKFTNKTECSAQCPTKPTPVVPTELVGVWRGIEIHNGFKKGEWVANVSTTHFTLYTPDLKVYLSGNASHKPATAHSKSGLSGELWINSTAGVLKGDVKMIYGDTNLLPELAYVTLAVSEPAPSTLVADFDTGMKTATDKVFGMSKCQAKNCAFHLPTGLPPVPIKTSALPAVSAEAEIDAVNFDVAAAFAGKPAATDKCNVFPTCNKCIGATAGGLNCGWCTTAVQYNDSSAPKYQCAGSKAGTASGWTCYGVYRTLSCYDYECDPLSKTCKQATPGSGGSFPTKASCDKSCGSPSPWQRCSLEGIYRGIQIDLNYGAGEWDATFSVYTKSTTANFTFVPTGYSYAGELQCRNVKDPTKLSSEGDFKLKLSNGTDLYGIYKQGGNQAETEGLSWALSNLNMTVPPTSFESAMPGLNASVYGYTKCASYKKGICIF